jgi:hypothetical protein
MPSSVGLSPLAKVGYTSATARFCPWLSLGKAPSLADAPTPVYPLHALANVDRFAHLQ